MPRPRAAACTQSHEDACARRMPRPAVVSTMLRGSGKYLQATKLETWVRRPRRDGASRERSECRETSSRWGCYACGLNLDDGASRVFGFFGSRTALVGVAGRRAVLPAVASDRVRLEEAPIPRTSAPRSHRPERKASCARCACSPAPSQPARQESSPHFPALLVCKWRGRRRAGAHPKRAH